MHTSTKCIILKLASLLTNRPVIQDSICPAPRRAAPLHSALLCARSNWNTKSAIKTNFPKVTWTQQFLSLIFMFACTKWFIFLFVHGSIFAAINRLEWNGMECIRFGNVSVAIIKDYQCRKFSITKTYPTNKDKMPLKSCFSP